MSQALRSLFVSLMSATLGAGVPLGWLWKRMIAVAFVDENNLPGIGAWLRKNKIASPLGYKERSGFCQYELYAFHHHA